MSLQTTLENLKGISRSELAKAAAKCKPRSATINQNTVHFDEGPFAGFDWKYSIGRDSYKTNVPLTMEFEVNGQRGYYEYRHIKPFAPAVVFVTTH